MGDYCIYGFYEKAGVSGVIKMRLAIVNLTGGGLSGGYKKYLKNMLPRLADHKYVDTLLCVSPEGDDIPSWFKEPSIANYCKCNPFTLRQLIKIPDRKMKECLKKFAPDILFLPVDRHIKFNNVPVVNMVRNMEPFIPNMKGDTLHEVFKKFVQRRLVINAIRQADHTIAVSRFVEDYLKSKLNVSKEKVSLVYHGLSSQINGNCVRPASVPVEWDSKFLFTCGSVRPARGLEDLFEAMSYLKASNLDINVVIAGNTIPGMRKYHNGLKRLIELKGLNHNVRWVGNLEDDEMCWCYNRCHLFVMTSRIEACPNIALEAMSHGCVIISTDSLPMPEFFREAAVYYSHGKGNSLSAAIQRMLKSDNYRKKISECGKKRASEFSWDRCVEKTVTELVKIAERFKT